jgi:hypothetical protein
MFKRIKEFIYQAKLEKNWDERTGTAPIAFELLRKNAYNWKRTEKTNKHAVNVM